MNGFTRACKLLDKYDHNRSDPTDHIYNVARVLDEVTMTEEESVNFHAYICVSDKSDFEYKPRSEYVTLGDLGEEELERLHKEVYGENQFNQITHEYPPNGNEINLVVSNIKGNDGQRMVRSCQEIPSDCIGQENVIETGPQSSSKKLQESWSDDEKKEN